MTMACVSRWVVLAFWAVVPAVAITLAPVAALSQQQVNPDPPSVSVTPDATPLAPGDGVGGLIPGAAVSGAAPEVLVGTAVKLRGLDKLTGRVETIEAPVGQVAMYERLQVDVKVCYSRTAARAPESSVFLQILDTKDEPPRLAFSGWMFASSPALSAMDHPRYDVWVLSCSTS
ncbi:MAG: DUF2155 domain-containing protein [Rhodobacteraceae bacterium]|nr:DUF2155 domain-containing protein [Paracoccaceae bacterium]